MTGSHAQTVSEKASHAQGIYILVQCLAKIRHYFTC
jgi:hypothetical protein